MNGPRPACGDVVDKPNVGLEWSTALPTDLEEREPCSWCFPDAATSDEIELDRADLVVSADGERIHRDEVTGDPDYKRGQNKRRSLRRMLAQGDVDPDEIAPDPIGGGSRG